MFGKAHGSPSIYPILADKGYFPKSELDKYCRPEGILRLHSDWTIPGCHFVGGSLGNGIGYASGLAQAQRDKNIYIMLNHDFLYFQLRNIHNIFIFAASCFFAGIP